jgi:hypothetical protein
MKKITKISLVILSAFSLMISTAFAGELTVTGGVTGTIKTGGAIGSTGKGIGVSNELDFSANGELDNGYTWKWQTQLDNADRVNDDTRLEVAAPQGTIAMYVSEGDTKSVLGYGIGAMGVGSDYAGPMTVIWGYGMNSYNNVQYHTPSGMLPANTMIKLAYSPNLSNAQGASAKADGVTETNAVGSSAEAIKITSSPIDGLTLGADYMTHGDGPNTAKYDQSSGAASIKYTTGPVSVGIAQSRVQPLLLEANATSGTITYETDFYGIQFAVNDALSISYSEEKSRKNTSSVMAAGGTVTNASEVEAEISHMQAAYTIGGATIGIAIADADNSDYVAAKTEKTTVFSVAMAF